MTLEGIDWTLLQTGMRVEIGDVVLEVTRPTSPCTNIAPAFTGEQFPRVSEKRHPGWSRWYSRVIREGTVTVGDAVIVTSPSHSAGLFSSDAE